MNKTITTWVMLLIFTASSAASVLTIRIMQAGTNTRWSINDRSVSIAELEGLLVRLASIDTNQLIYISTETNVPSSRLVQTIGVVQRSGLYNLGLFCSGADGTNTGRWAITIDAKRKHFPTYRAKEPTLSGFRKEKVLPLEIAPVILDAEKRPTNGWSRSGDPRSASPAGQP